MQILAFKFFDDILFPILKFIGIEAAKLSIGDLFAQCFAIVTGGALAFTAIHWFVSLWVGLFFGLPLDNRGQYENKRFKVAETVTAIISLVLCVILVKLVVPILQ